MYSLSAKTFLGASLALVALSLTAQVAEAGVTVYTNEASFLSASTGITTVTFEGTAPVNGTTGYGPSLTIGNATFTSPNDTLFTIDPGYNAGLYDYGTGQIVYSNGPLGVNLTSGYTAAGLSFQSIIPGLIRTFRIDLSTGNSYNVSLTAGPANGWSFFGVTTDVGDITSITLTPTTGNYTLADNVHFGTASLVSAVPEPGEVATGVAFAGALCLGMVRARRRSRLIRLSV